MHKVLLLSSIILIGGCTSPTVDVKDRWNRALINYSFVPLYPARRDVQVGDIRVHTIKNAAETLDSRLMSKASQNQIVQLPPKFGPAILPGIEAVRSISLDREASGVSGFLRRFFGKQIDASSTLYVSLGALETAEVADQLVARDFYSYVRSSTASQRGEENDFMWGLCVAAKSLGNPRFDDIGISIVTRVIKANEITYSSGSALTNGAGNIQRSVPIEEADSPTSNSLPKNKDGNSFAALTGSSLPKATIPGGVVIGVDALMIRPIKVMPDVPERCAAISGVFEESQARVLRQKR